jgi:Zn-dependent membrane protease YugP
MDIIILLIGAAISIVAQIYVTGNYSKYKKVATKSQMTGLEVARTILDSHGLNNVYVVETNGMLSDHYDPSRKVVRLSNEIFHGTSIASYSVAAHEVGHAIQDKEKYNFMQFRSKIFPMVNISSYGGYIAVLIGLIFGHPETFWIGIALELVVLFFQLITLPVEFDASRRALAELKKHELLSKKELTSSKKMLNAAAFTYVAGVINTILQILRLILIFGNTNRD